MTLTLGQLPGERQAQVGFMGSETHDGGSRLGLTLAPAGDVDGPGSKGVAVMAVDPNGPAAERGFQIGDRILDVAGKEVSTLLTYARISPSCVRRAGILCLCE